MPEQLSEHAPSGRAPRHAILDLAPLELDCMTVIWSLGAGTVRDIQKKLMPTRPRAYTTVMTIMDRLAQKGIVSRQKVGRAYRYQANLSSDDARNSAVQKVIAGFFNGSAEALASHLATILPATPMPVPASEFAQDTCIANDGALSPSSTERPGPAGVEAQFGVNADMAAPAMPFAVGPSDLPADEPAPESRDESLR